MKRGIEEYAARLSPEAVDECSDRVRSFLGELGLPKKDILRYAMTVEEILLDTMDAVQEPPELCLRTGRRFVRNSITLEIDGEPRNYYAQNDSELGTLSGSVLKTLGLSPEYQYKNGRNRYSFTIKQKEKNPLIALAVAVALAALVGALGLLLPDPVRASMLNDILIPLNDTFLDLMGGIAGPMIFLSVAWGIYGIGDASTLKNVGGKLCGGYIGSFVITASVLTLLFLPVFSLRFSDTSGVGSALNSIFSMLLGLVPKDIFSPFETRNTLQIIFLAVLFGISMLFLEQKTDFVAQVVEQINYIIQFLIGAISKLVPAFIFIVLLKLMWSNMLSSLVGIGKLIVVFLGAVLAALAVLVVRTAVKNKVNPLLLVKKGLPTLIIALSTASSAAAFSTNLEAARDRYGIDEKLVSFGIPLGVVTYKASSTLNYMLQSLFFAEMYAVDVSVSWIAVMMLTSLLLSLATPPIPGGGLAAYAVLFAQLGIPEEALAIALACETVFDFVITGTQQFSIPLVLLNVAQGLGLVDQDTLRK